ncbi:unnamed protein product [Eruca vesicaria subsp. sativa]|uniref:FBD domain-containing protein n=1 Tax=Eruca vesicaria subsp. sativa TaxID=29727 RepID=A0ABC8K1P8_ERUVS|nr:unnamed protein product [Eruca vesicaria subsp. sativa]
MMRSCCLLSCRVKVLKVYGYKGSCGELNQMRHFINNLRFLKVVKVKVHEEQDNYLSLTSDLTKLLSTASSKVQDPIHLILFLHIVLIHLS